MDGIDRFREYFEGHEDKYAIIGGAACDVLFGQAGLDFRVTKDIDLVLCVEVVDIEFGQLFGRFLDAAGYQSREKGEGERQFYRFQKPTDQEFPAMVELFARRPEDLALPDSATFTKIPVEEQVVSLSAILLDDDYFNALKERKQVVDGVSIIEEDLLIPFKARAYLDLSARKADGEKVDSKQIKKHRNDIFRLVDLVPSEGNYEVSDAIRKDIENFLEIVEKDGTFDPKSIGRKFSLDEGITILRRAYGIEAA